MRPKKKKKRYFRRSGKFFAYILECCDGTYYTGYTNDLKKRLKLHNSGRGAKYTMMRRPVAVAWSKKYRQFRSAFKTEALIKRLSRQQKEALVRGFKR
jgi:putative endonuclease